MLHTSPGVNSFYRVCSKDDLKLDDVRFQFQKPKQQIEYLSALDVENIAAIASFEIPPGVAEPLLDETAGGQDAFSTNDDESAALEPVVDEQRAMPPLIVLAFSCVAAFLALACIALTLYIIKSLRSQMLASKTAWELLPRFWRHPTSQQETSAKAKKHLLGGGRLLLQPDRPLDVEEGSAERHGLRTEDKPVYFDAVSDMESEWDDVDEKYQDALDVTPLPLIHDLPLEENVSHDDPPLPPTGSCPLDHLTADRSTPLMRELCPSPVSRPAWSVRAIDSPALGLSSRESDGVASTPQPLIHPRRRAYRSPVPEFDIALAMQLRPGLGIGADSAWMVRFLMTLFGWFAVALTGNTR